jgi:hypothetical protein
VLAGAGLMVLLGVAAAPASHAAARVTASPALFPRFDPSVKDYVTRCEPRGRLRLSVGAHSTRLRLGSGQSTSFVVRSGHARRRYFVRCLPRDFPSWSAQRPGRPQAQWYVVAPCCDTKTYVAIFDTHGVPVWWIHTPRVPSDAKLLPDGNLAWAQPQGKELAPGVSSGAFEEHRLDGKLLRTFPLPDGTLIDQHELQLLPNGDYVVVAYVPRDGVDLSPYGGPSDATVLDAQVTEVTPQHRVAWSWSSADHIDPAETGRWYQNLVLPKPVPLPDGRTAYDIVHINAVDPYGPQRFLVSLRHTDAVYAVDRGSGDVLWKLGGTQTPRSLRMVGDGVTDLGGQHDVRALDDGTVTLHDNGTDLARPPRALRFRIDAGAMTATLVEMVADRAGARSPCCGSARKLPGGDWVVSWGGTPLIEEKTAAGRRVFSLRLPNRISYRAFPVLPGRLTYRALRSGMNAMNGPAATK